MSVARTRRRKKRFAQESEQNLTPLIDCVFLLLIFFMVTTVFKQPYRLQVELPQARNAKEALEKKLVASITEAKHKWVLFILEAAKRVGVDTILLATEDEKDG